MTKIPIITEEAKKTLGMPIKTDWGDIDTRSVFDIPCDKHGVWYDCRLGCLMCFKDRGMAK